MHKKSAPKDWITQNDHSFRWHAGELPGLPPHRMLLLHISAAALTWKIDVGRLIATDKIEHAVRGVEVRGASALQRITCHGER